MIPETEPVDKALPLPAVNVLTIILPEIIACPKRVACIERTSDAKTIMAV
jgi:hypothetical protein